MSTLLYQLMNQINLIKNNISNFKQYQTTATISANSSLDITTDDFDIDFTKALFDIRILDPDDTSDTYDTYIDASAVSIVSVAKDGSKATIINYSDDDLEFLINIITLS